MTMTTDNRRQFHRIDFDGMADLSFFTKSYGACQVKNLSLTGMCVLGHFRKHRQQDCLVKLFHKEKTGNNCFHATGTVVWSSSEGIGLRFARMSFENYMLLQTTLIQKADQPEVILRELPSEVPFEITSY